MSERPADASPKHPPSDASLSHERLLLAEEAGSLGIWEWNAKTDQSYWSPGNYRLFDLPEDVPGSYSVIRSLVHPDDLERLDREVRESAQTGTDFRSEYRVVRKDGSVRWLMSLGRFLEEDGGPRRMMGVNIDVTARHQADDATRRAGEAEAAARMSAALAHQINNPLATLTNSMFLLRQQFSGDARAEAVVKMAQEALGRVTSITRHLLSVHADQRAWKPTDFSEAVQEIVSFHHESAAARNIRVSHRTRVQPGVTAPRHFRGLLSSLLTDAIETSRREGEVRIHVMELADHRKQRLVRLNLAQHSSVISPQQEHLFPELAGVSTERMGGIHLWTALTALKQLNGTMRLRGDGSSRLRGLSVTFPLKSA